MMYPPITVWSVWISFMMCSGVIVARVLFYKVCRLLLVVVGEADYVWFVCDICDGLCGSVPQAAAAGPVCRLGITSPACRVRFIKYAIIGGEGSFACPQLGEIGVALSGNPEFVKAFLCDPGIVLMAHRVSYGS